MREQVDAVVFHNQILALGVGKVADLGLEEVEEHEKLLDGRRFTHRVSFPRRRDELFFEEVQHLAGILHIEQAQGDVLYFGSTSGFFVLYPFSLNL